MPNEQDCLDLHIPLGQGWTIGNSPFVAMHDRSAGGVSAIFLGEPRCGKSRASYRRAYRLFQRERLFIRGQLDTTWLLQFKSRATVWVPRGATFSVSDNGENVPVEVQEYVGFADLLRRAKTGRANVLYWPRDEREQWVGFLESLLNRKDREPQLILDDECQQIAPQGASSEGGAYQRMVRFRTILEQGPKAWVSFLLSSHQAHDTDYQCVELCLYAVLMTASSPPTKFASTCHRILRALPSLPKGGAFVVGSTLGGGARYQRMAFTDRLGATPKLVVTISGPPLPSVTPSTTKGTKLSDEERERIREMDRQGVRDEEIAVVLHRGIATIRRALSTQGPPPLHLS